MPRLRYDPDESHALLTQAEAATATDPELADLYRQLATVGVDLDACTPDETVREQLGMPPLPGTAVTGEQPAGHGQDGGHHPHVA